MSNTRADLGFGAALGDLSSFTPEPKPAPKIDPRPAAEAAGFRSREAAPENIPPKKQQRRRRTGRNAQLNIKAKPETIEAFYRVCDAHGWGLGEALEHAVKLLEDSPN